MLWQVLIQRRLCGSEAEARGMILAGRVLVGDRPARRVGEPVAEDVPVSVRGRREYASRGGEKLAAALARFGVDARGRVALDAGASTGGFTDCLLRHGAERVYAVDVGYGQLLGRLRQDPRVVTMERTNLSDISPADLESLPTLLTLDLSYLPLGEAWRIAQGWLSPDADVISLVKPLFEVDDPIARRTGRIEGEQPYAALLQRLIDSARSLGWRSLGLMPSPIRGSGGTVEFLLHARTRGGADAGPVNLPIAAAVAAALNPAGAGPLPPPPGLLQGH